MKNTFKSSAKRPQTSTAKYKYDSATKCVGSGVDYLVSACSLANAKNALRRNKVQIGIVAVCLLLFVVYMNLVDGLLLAALPIALFFMEPWAMSVAYAIKHKSGSLFAKQLKLSSLLTLMHIAVCFIVLAPCLVMVFMDNAAKASIASGDNVTLPGQYLFWFNLALVFAAVVLSICIALNILSQRHLNKSERL